MTCHAELRAAADRRDHAAPGEQLVGRDGRPHPPAAHARAAWLRRRRIILVTKWLLPVLALALLATIALWPEFERFTNAASTAVRRVASRGGRGEADRRRTITASTSTAAPTP